MTAPLVRPSTAAGWAPPYTDTPEEIAARREAAAQAHQWRREHTTRQRKAAEQSAEQWRQAIRDALTELEHDATSETGAAR
jgi:Flp pilus assembly protein TadB